MSLTYFSSHVGLIISQFVNPIAMAAISWKYYLVFCVTNASLFMIVWLVFPETKGYSLEEIALIFEGDRAVVKNVGFLEKGEITLKNVQIEEILK